MMSRSGPWTVLTEKTRKRQVIIIRIGMRRSGAAGLVRITLTIKDCIDLIGTENATIVLSHYKDATTTLYEVVTNIDFTGKENIDVKFDKGAEMSGCTSGVTLPPPENIIAKRDSRFLHLAWPILISPSRSDYPNWWATNTTPGTTDMSAAITAMVNSDANVFYSTTRSMLLAAYLLPMTKAIFYLKASDRELSRNCVLLQQRVTPLRLLARVMIPHLKIFISTLQTVRPVMRSSAMTRQNQSTF